MGYRKVLSSFGYEGETWRYGCFLDEAPRLAVCSGDKPPELLIRCIEESAEKSVTAVLEYCGDGVDIYRFEGQ